MDILNINVNISINKKWRYIMILNLLAILGITIFGGLLLQSLVSVIIAGVIAIAIAFILLKVRQNLVFVSPTILGIWFVIQYFLKKSELVSESFDTRWVVAIFIGVVISAICYFIYNRFHNGISVLVIILLIGLYLLGIGFTVGNTSLNLVLPAVENIYVGTVTNQNNEAVTTQNNETVTTQNNETVTTQNNETVTTQNNEKVETQNNENVETQNNENVETQNNENVETQNNETVTNTVKPTVTPQVETHECEFTVTKTVAATCTTAGYKLYTCSCGESYKETIAATGHDWSEWVLTTSPTVDSYGIETRTCQTCGKTETRQVAKLEPIHECEFTVTKTVAATCTTAGYKEYTCSCGESYKETIAATGHDWSEWVLTTSPTVDSYGIETRTCQTCGKTETRQVEKLETPVIEKATASINWAEHVEGAQVMMATVVISGDTSVNITSNLGVSTRQLTTNTYYVEITLTDGSGIAAIEVSGDNLDSIESTKAF